ncbi:MFS transporter [Methylobacterium nonmethylotrophicum]|uniref:MFS transporter n=1 Tax=Methylobacterium nonmethylotrophicum TaxID=1141884 RepID=A0A4Z0NSF1_9HYPH|nr:MFS transporter [Methylobacterium nonmethylotrophicum]TGD99664.1 MFS transporter [Methylobacterium nonmethylotrophicum]
MFEALDDQARLSRNQVRLIAATMAGNVLDFFDLFLIGFVLALVAGPWSLTFGQSASVLLASGLGATVGAIFWGWMADRVGRRPVFTATIATFASATGALALVPEGGWVWFVALRFVVGFGAGGLYCVDLPLVQEFVPTRMRGRIAGLVTAAVPVGLLLASLATATLAPIIGWRGLFLLGAAPALVLLAVRAWVPESPRWLIMRGRPSEARRSVAWALAVPPETLSLPVPTATGPSAYGFGALLRHPRSLAVSWLTNLGIQTGHYGVTMWAPTLLVLILGVTPATASWYMAVVGVAGLAGRFLCAWLSDRIGRRACGVLFGASAATALLAAGLLNSAVLGGISVFWLLLVVGNVFVDGGFAVVGPYAAEVWPSRLRATGLGSAYGFGGIGKMLGPLGLALIVGTVNVVAPQATVDAVPLAFAYLSAWFALMAIAFGVFGFETRGRSIEELDAALEGADRPSRASAAPAPAEVSSR